MKRLSLRRKEAATNPIEQNFKDAAADVFAP